MKNKNVIFLTIFCLLSLLFIFRLFITPLFLALVFSVVLYPFLSFIKLSKKKHQVLIMTLGVSLLILVPIFLLISLGSTEAFKFINSPEFSKYFDFKIDIIFQDPKIVSILHKLSLSETDIKYKILDQISKFKFNVLETVQSIMYMIPTLLFHFSVMISAMYFMMLDGYKVVHLFFENSLYDKKFGRVLVTTFKHSSYAIILATLGSALIQTLVFLIPTIFIHFNYLPLLCFSIFIFSMIPIIGTVPIIAILVFYHFSLKNYEFMILYIALGFILGFIDSFFKAYILQKKVKINPYIALLSTFAGIYVFGALGLLLGPIVIITLLKCLHQSLKQKNDKI